MHVYRLQVTGCFPLLHFTVTAHCNWMLKATDSQISTLLLLSENVTLILKLIDQLPYNVSITHAGLLNKLQCKPTVWMNWRKHLMGNTWLLHSLWLVSVWATHSELYNTHWTSSHKAPLHNTSPIFQSFTSPIFQWRFLQHFGHFCHQHKILWCLTCTQAMHNKNIIINTSK